jgi:hypothetical protein
MKKETRSWRCGWVVGLCALVVVLTSCESRDRYVGVYRAEADGTARGAVVLELRANGDGLWKMSSGEEKETFVEVPITWYIKHHDLRVHTRAGGVLVGKIHGDTIRMTLPGSKTVTFRRTR